MDTKKYIVGGFMILALGGCTAEELAALQAGPNTGDQLSPDPTPSPSASTTPCWYDDIAVNGAENLAYPGPSQAAGNTFYACTGTTDLGHYSGVWIAFYSNGTSYIGLDGGITMTGTTDSSCGFHWGSDGLALGGTVNSVGELTTVDIQINRPGLYAVETYHMTCHAEN